MDATDPAARLRSPDEYTPGPVQLVDLFGQKAYRIRSLHHAEFVLGRDDRGGVAHDIGMVLQQMRDAGVPGVPEYSQLPLMHMFPWLQGSSGCPAHGATRRHGPMIRRLLPYLGRGAVDRATPAIYELAQLILDRVMPPRGGVLDAIGFARELAFTATAYLTGLPCTPEVRGAVLGYFDEFVKQESVTLLTPEDPAERRFFEQMLHSGEPGLIADLAAAAAAGPERGGLSEAEAMALIRGLWQAGTDTTGVTMATLLGLLAGSSFQDIAREARGRSGSDREDFVRACVDETVRLHPAFPEMAPRTYADIELPGPDAMVIPAASQLLISLNAIGRDPGLAGADPDEFRPGRRCGSGFGFGAGFHSCAGQYLARVIATAGVTAVLDRTSVLELAEDGWRANSGVATRIVRADLAYKG